MLFKVCVLFLLSILGHLDTVEAQSAPSVQVASLGISAKDPSSEFDESLAHGFAGVDVVVYFSAPGESVLSINERNTEVKLSADGVVLPLSPQMGDSMFSFQLNENPSSGIVQLASEKMPSKDAKKLSLKGQIILNVGKEANTEDVEFEVVENGKVKLGLIEATIEREQDMVDTGEQMIQFSASKPFDFISKMEFFDVGGNAVASYPAGDGIFTMNDVMVYQRGYVVASAAKTLKVRVTYFTKVETLGGVQKIVRS